LNDGQNISEALNQSEIVSFDIFDTLLVRPYIEPTNLFSHLEFLENTPGFASERISAEKRARCATSREEVTYDEIYSEIAERFAPLKQIELDIERRTLQAYYRGKSIFDTAIRLGKRVVLTSDTYLPRDFLENILREKGYNSWEKLYVSSSVMKTKHTGSLYHHITEDLGVPPSKVVHIGDNKHSDSDLPRELGFSTILLSKAIEDLFGRDFRARKLYEARPSSLGVSTMLGLRSMMQTAEYWHGFGLAYAGPAILAYAQWLDYCFKKDEITDAFFVARDGYLLKKAFDLLKTSKTRSHYVYAPRILNFIVNMNDQNGIEGLNAVRAIIGYFRGIDEKLDSVTPAQIDTLEQGRTFLNDHQHEYQRFTDFEKSNFAKYLDNMCAGKRIGVIDTLTGNFSSQKLVAAILGERVAKGYYWNIYGDLWKNKKCPPFRVFKEGYEHWFLNWEIMEFVMTSPEPPVASISEGCPVFKKVVKEELARIERFTLMAEGVMDFIKHMRNIFGNLRLSISADDIIELMNIFFTMPTKADKKEFNSLKHATDPSHTVYRPLMPAWHDNTTLTMNHEETDEKKFFLFNIIPFLKIRYTRLETRCSLFGLPILTIRRKMFPNYKTSNYYFLFGILPIWRVFYYNQKRKYYLMSLIPLWKLYFLDNETRYYLFGCFFLWSGRVLKKNQDSQSEDFSPDEICLPASRPKVSVKPSGIDIAFIVPQPIKGSGGHRNIFRFVRYFSDFGHKITVYYTQSDLPAAKVQQQVSAWFYDVRNVPFFRYGGRLGEHDTAIATWWETAYILKDNLDRINNKPFYLVQDFEPYFYPIGSEYILAENSYKLGFTHICSGQWCENFLKKKYGARAYSFQFPIDRTIYNTDKPRTKLNKHIVFFAKPEMPRRCYRIGLAALERLHQLVPDIEITLFGSPHVNKLDFSFNVNYVAIVPTLEDLADLYRNADLGLVFSTTNPSLVPYEMMSCGCPVADMDWGEDALDKYGGDSNNVFLLNPIPEIMGEQLAELLANPEKMYCHSKSGQFFATRSFMTEQEVAKVVEGIIKKDLSRI
jgi:predicted HAD superfamily hydrolase